MSFGDLDPAIQHALKSRIKAAASIIGPESIDLEDKESLYGKIDTLGNAVRIMVETTDAIVPVRGARNVWAINFVARAFYDLKRDYESLVAKGFIEPFMGMEQLSPVNGWDDLGGYYKANVDAIRAIVRSQCLRYYDKNIRDFSDFVKVFFKIAAEYEDFPVITKTGTLRSSKTPNSVSGLVLDLLSVSPDDESTRAEMLLSPSFTGFANKCAQYGFRLDKENPWRLIANLGSPKMADYAKISEVELGSDASQNTFFRKFCVRTHLEDMDSVRNILMSFYNEFVRLRPKWRVTRYNDQGQKQVAVYKREPLLNMSGQDRYDTRFWMEVLLKVRLMETRLLHDVSQSHFDGAIKKVMKVYKRYGFEVALNHLNSYVKEVDYDMDIFAKNIKNILLPRKLKRIMLTIHKK